MASKNETVGSTDAQVRMGEVAVYFLLLIYHRANLRAVTTECENQSTDFRRNIVFGLILPRARRGQLGFSIQDAGIASCVSGPRLAHVFLWYWFDGPGVKKARRGAESEEEHQGSDGSTLKRIPRCRPCPGVDVSLLEARLQGAEAVIESPEITQGLVASKSVILPEMVTAMARSHAR
ncbi:hypothetical protein D6D13_10196 [Aureobasidium pullulans]|uniref:Uncharacterized protein n=1 Tax=Aureobasidium pullulans TaxID=5580 RepID=A0A4V4IY13_AURPU|nr:hypothetical protein D6D13_10196 [Aureobasidium pullulans]